MPCILTRKTGVNRAPEHLDVGVLLLRRAVHGVPEAVERVGGTGQTRAFSRQRAHRLLPLRHRFR